jgi:hypothetical protein
MGQLRLRASWYRCRSHAGHGPWVSRRMSGKSDVIDAEHAARQVLASIDMSVPKSADGPVEAIRFIKIARDSAVKARSTTMITLKATLVTADVELRAEQTRLHSSIGSRPPAEYEQHLAQQSLLA